jgi:hypothetical protein
MGIEESYIRKTEGLIRSIKHGTKTPNEANVEYYLERVKKSNIGMYEELTKRYQIVLDAYKGKKEKNEKKLFAY